MTLVLAISGKKQSGKTTWVNRFEEMYWKFFTPCNPGYPSKNFTILGFSEAWGVLGCSKFISRSRDPRRNQRTNRVEKMLKIDFPDQGIPDAIDC